MFLIDSLSTLGFFAMLLCYILQRSCSLFSCFPFINNKFDQSNTMVNSFSEVFSLFISSGL